MQDFNSYLRLERQFSPNTISAYTADAGEFLAFCAEKNAQYQTAGEEVIEDFFFTLRSKGLSVRSIFRKAEAVKSFYKFLIISGIVKKDPFEFIVSPKLTGKIPDTLTKEEMQKLLSYAAQNFEEQRTLAIVELFYACGLRVSELTALRLENIDLKEKWVLASGKGGKQRFVPVHGRACSVLQAYLAARAKKFEDKKTDSEIFLSRAGRKLSRVAVWKDIARLGVKAGVEKPLHPHLFRHTFATHLLSGGADLRSLQEMLGHANLDTTQIYTKVDITDLKEKHKKFHPFG